MLEPLRKSTVEEIRVRFDADVERFANLETGQAAAQDSPLLLELLAEAAAAVRPGARRLLDIGCGAGNYSLRLLERFPDADVTLVDLSERMLDRARERVASRTRGIVRTIQSDVRSLELEPESVDVIVAGAVLHHLRSEAEWRSVFAAMHRWLAPGGGLWIADLVTHSHPAVARMFERRYGAWLASQRDEAYRDTVLAYIAREDTPAPVSDQLRWLREAGFAQVDLLHARDCFAALGAVKAAT